MRQIINQHIFSKNLLWAGKVLVDGSIAKNRLDIKIHALLKFAWKIDNNKINCILYSKIIRGIEKHKASNGFQGVVVTKALSLTKPYSGSPELPSQLDPDFWTSVFISTLPNLSKNHAKSVQPESLICNLVTQPPPFCK